MSQLGRFLEQRRTELGLSRRDVAEQADLSYPYVSQLETGERQPALKALRALAPVLRVPVEELAALVAGSGDWSATSYDAWDTPASMVMATAPRSSSEPSTGRTRAKTLLSLERRLRDVPPLERIALLNELIAQAVAELGGEPS